MCVSVSRVRASCASETVASVAVVCRYCARVLCVRRSGCVAAFGRSLTQHGLNSGGQFRRCENTDKR